MQMDCSDTIRSLGSKPLYPIPQRIHDNGKQENRWPYDGDWSNPWLMGERFNRAVRALVEIDVVSQGGKQADPLNGTPITKKAGADCLGWVELGTARVGREILPTDKPDTAGDLGSFFL